MLIGLQRFKPMVGCQQANTSLERNVGKCYSYLEVHLRPLNSKPLDRKKHSHRSLKAKIC
jgi:hypothetical protein